MVTRPRDAYVARGYGLRIWAALKACRKPSDPYCRLAMTRLRSEIQAIAP
jgi:hypothetical protein